MVNAVRDRLSDLRFNARNLRQTLTDIFHKFGVRTISFLHDDFNFAGVHARRMFVEFGASRAARCRNDFGNVVQNGFDDVADAVRFF